MFLLEVSSVGCDRLRRLPSPGHCDSVSQKENHFVRISSGASRSSQYVFSGYREG